MVGSREVSVRLRADISNFQRQMVAASAATKGFAKDLDSADSRMGNLVQTGLALGPALVPIGAAAVPAIAGLTTQLGLAVAAAGATVFAFQGVGDALKSLNDFHVEPTAEHFAKMREEMKTLGPAGQEFVFFLDSIAPDIQDLQRATQNGLFPGVTAGLEDLMVLKPQMKDLLKTLSSSVGDLVAQAGDNLNDARWVDFFEFLDREARPTLMAMGQALGNFIEGIANMVVAFNPLSDSFTNGMLDMSRSFNEWTQGLSDSQSFQDFVTYIQANGPQAMETLTAVAKAILSLVEAAAPVGAIALPIIQALADGFSAIAQSPAGPILIAAASGLSAISRAIAIYNAANGSALMGLLDSSGKKGMLAGAGWRAAGAGIGVFALSMTDIDDKMGVSKTAAFGLMGAIAGPGGAVAGTLVGALFDYREAAGEGAKVTAQLRREISAAGTDFGAMDAAVKTAFASVDQMNQDSQSGMGAFWDVFTGSSAREEGARAAVQAQEELAQQSEAMVEIARNLGREIPEGMSLPLTDLTRIATQAAPAMTALGYSLDDLANASPDELDLYARVIASFIKQSDSTAGRTKVLAGAFADLRNDIIPTTTAAENLQAALDAILGPELGVSAATDQWTLALRQLNRDLSHHNKTLEGNSHQALVNREAIRGRVVDLEDLLVAEAKAGAGSGRLSRMLKNQRQALIDAGTAAGLSKDELKAYLNQLGLTPKLVRTILDTVDTGRPARKAVGAELKRLMERVTTPLDADPSGAKSGAAEAQNAIDAVHGKTVDIITHYATVGNRAPGAGVAGARGMLLFANGDVMNGHQPMLARGGPTRMWNEPETGGEAYIPLRNDSRRPRAKGLLEQTAGLLGGEVFWYAGGGSTGSSNFGGGRRRGHGMEDADKAAGSLAKRLKDAQKELEKETSQRKDLISNMKSFRSDVAGSFDHDPFGNGLAGLDLQLSADRNDAQAMKRALNKAKKKALDGGLFAALAASGDLNTAQQLAGLSKGQIRAREKLFSQTNAAQNSLGQFAANEKFGDAMKDSAKAIRELRHEIKGLKNHIGKNVEDGARRGTADRDRKTAQRSRTGR